MNYPVWEISTYGGGLLVALIATFHVFVAHFAVGGGLFLVVTEMVGRRRKDERIIKYVHGHTKFFILITMVVGALSGVGIWLIISVLNPGATSVLIHTFVFAWATEWVFFLVEIVSLLVYYYTFDNMDPKTHVIVGWIYFFFAWLSLLVIAGIISFMLTPGRWLETKNFWDALINPSFIPSLLFRTFMALILAGVYGLITSTSIKGQPFRQTMVRYCVLWLAAPFILLLPSAWWYLQAIPGDARGMIMGISPEIPFFANAFLWLTPIIILSGLFMAVRLPRLTQRSLGFLILVIAFLFMGSFETVREAGRRPYIIYGHMYSNSILKSELSRTQEQGALISAKWTRQKSVGSGNRLEAGRELFNILCLSCHSFGGPRNDIFERMQDMTADDFSRSLREMGVLKGYMPAFPGTRQEGDALTEYLFEAFEERGR